MLKNIQKQEISHKSSNFFFFLNEQRYLKAGFAASREQRNGCQSHMGHASCTHLIPTFANCLLLCSCQAPESFAPDPKNPFTYQLQSELFAVKQNNNINYPPRAYFIS